MQRDLVRAAEGIVGGLAGTMLMGTVMKLGSRLPERLQPPAPAEHPGEFMVSRLERALGRALPRRLHRAAVEGSRWQYGALWPTLFATVAPRFLRLRSLGQAAIAGASLGAAVWTVGYAGWLPAAHLVPPLYRQRPTRSIASLLGHAAYGIGAVVPIYLIEQRLRRRRLLRRLFR